MHWGWNIIATGWGKLKPEVSTVPLVELTAAELGILKQSARYCLQKCRSGGPAAGCEDCGLLEQALRKMEQAT